VTLTVIRVLNEAKKNPTYQNPTFDKVLNFHYFLIILDIYFYERDK